jgi:hypothetical protein
MTNLFQGLDLTAWCEDNGLYALFGVDPTAVDPTRKLEKGIYETVDPDNRVPFPPEFDDLARLHFLARTRKVTTVLEIGAGKSTVVLADAMRRNEAEFGEYVQANLRRANPFEVHTLDQSRDWIEVCRRTLPAGLERYVRFTSASVRMSTFNGRACTLYDTIPNVCPDLIYLDGPDQFAVEGEVHGISTRSADRLPMSADLLLLEPFLLPGTLIVVDGRTANARFLKNNFQRSWRYAHHVEADLHTFELIEPPLGRLNERQIRFCLGDEAVVGA